MHLGANTLHATTPTRFLKIDFDQLASGLVAGWDTAIIEGRDFRIISVRRHDALLKGTLSGRDQLILADLGAIDDIKRSEDVAA